MPVGVPKVPFKLKSEEEEEEEEEEDASWVDLYNLVYRTRIVFFGKRLDHELMNHIMNLLTYLTIQDETEDVTMFINSPGGWLISGLTVYDMMQAMEPDVQTIGLGEVSSTATFVLLGGEITKRLALSNAKIKLRQPIADLFSQNQKEKEKKKEKEKEKEKEKDQKETTKKKIAFLRELNEFQMAFDRFLNCYVLRTRKPKDVIIEDMIRNDLMTPDEAQAYGIIDGIWIG